MDEKDRCVDLATENALLKWKDEILAGVREEIKESISALNSHITEVFDIRIDRIEQDIVTLRGQSDVHYEEMKTEKKENTAAHAEIMEKVDAKFAAMRTEVSGLDRRQSTDEGKEAGKDSAVALQVNKKAVFWAAAAVVLGVVIFLAGTALPDGKDIPALPPKEIIIDE